MYFVHDYTTRMCVHNLLMAPVTFIPYMHEYLCMFLNAYWRMNLMNQASGSEKEMNLAYLMILNMM